MDDAEAGHRPPRDAFGDRGGGQRGRRPCGEFRRGHPLTLLAYRLVGRRSGRPFGGGSRTAAAEPVAWRRAEAVEVASFQRECHPGQDQRPRQPPHGGPARPARRAAAPGRGGVPRHRRSTCGATRSPSTATDAERVGRLFEELVVAAAAGPAPRRRRRCAAPSTWCSADERPTRGAHRRGPARRQGPRRCARRRAGQKRYIDAIRDNVITFGIGPAGTGKSWLAVAMAVQALQAKQVERIILTRPAVEAGERLGLPARRPDGQGRPVPAPALRRAVRHGRARGRAAAARAPGRSRSRRWRSCAAARSTAASSSSTRRRTPRPSR